MQLSFHLHHDIHVIQHVCMQGNFRQCCSFYQKLPNIHARFHCNTSKKKVSVKRTSTICFEFYLYSIQLQRCVIYKRIILNLEDCNYPSSLLKAFQIHLFFNTSIFHFIGTLKKVQRIQKSKNTEMKI